MATLTTEELVKIRRAAARKAARADVPISWVKGALNDSAQAVENVLSSVALQSQISSSIDAASSPYGITFTAQEKRWIAAMVMEVKFTRDVVG